MNNFFQQNKLVESRWLVMHRQHPLLCFSEISFYKFGE